jgi:hypothetical protein
MADRIEVGKNNERIVPVVFVESDVCYRNTIESRVRNPTRMQSRCVAVVKNRFDRGPARSWR